MNPMSFLLVKSLLLSVAFGGPIDTQLPLGLNNPHASFENNDFFDSLPQDLQDIVINPSPPFSPCYRTSELYNQTKCQEIGPSKLVDQWTSDQAGGYFYSNWASCQSMAESCTISLNTTEQPADNATCFQGSVPSKLIKISGTREFAIPQIRLALGAAYAQNASIIIKNTGRSSGPGMTGLWTHDFRYPKSPIIVDEDFIPQGCPIDTPKEAVVHLAGGETWGNVYNEVNRYPKGYTVVGGTCPSVGVSGWLQGGGHSPLSPVYGLGVDNIREVELVLPDGQVINASRCQNEDLFFAIRGGGGGTWGVIISLKYKVIPKHKIVRFNADLTNLSDEDSTKLIQFLVSNATMLASNGWGGYIRFGDKRFIEITNANPLYTKEAAEKDLKAVWGFLNTTNIPTILEEPDSWFDFFKKNLEPSKAHKAGYSAAVASRLINSTTFSIEADRTKLANVLSDIYKQNVPGTNNPIDFMIMLVTPTTFPHDNTSALHPSWAISTWLIRVNALWSENAWPSFTNTTQFFQTAHNSLNDLRTLVGDTGASINEADIWEDDHASTFWGEKNYERLRGIKGRIDPGNILSNWQAVNFDSQDKRYRCYPRK